MVLIPLASCWSSKRKATDDRPFDEKAALHADEVSLQRIAVYCVMFRPLTFAHISKRLKNRKCMYLLKEVTDAEAGGIARWSRNDDCRFLAVFAVR